MYVTRRPNILCFRMIKTANRNYINTLQSEWKTIKSHRTCVMTEINVVWIMRQPYSVLFRTFKHRTELRFVIECASTERSICACASVRVYVCMHTMHVCVYPRVCVSMLACVRLCVCESVCVCIRLRACIGKCGSRTIMRGTYLETNVIVIAKNTPLQF